MNVLDMLSLTSMQGDHMKLFMIQKENGQRMTLQQSQMTIFDSLEIGEESMLSAAESRAKLFQLLETAGDSMTLEELSSLTSYVSPISSDHNIYSLKTSVDSLVMAKGIRSRPSSEPWMTSGMMSNGICLTLRTSESPKIGRGPSLSDILEDQVDEKYFLSAERAETLLKSMED